MTNTDCSSYSSQKFQIIMNLPSSNHASSTKRNLLNLPSCNHAKHYAYADYFQQIDLMANPKQDSILGQVSSSRTNRHSKRGTT